MVSEGVVWFAVFLLFAIPFLLVAAFVALFVVYRRKGKAGKGFLIAAIGVVALALILVPAFLRARSLLDMLAAASG
jgi:hypothetical protein